MVALGVDLEGKKLPLGFWEGATENHEICEELLEGLERRGLKLSKRGPLGYRWWRRDHQGAQGPVRQEAHPPAVYAPQRSQHPAPPAQTLPQAGRTTSSRLPWSRTATRTRRRCCRSSSDAFATSTESAADSLVESLEEVLMLHKLKVPCSTAQEPALDESYREHVLHGSQLRAQHQTLP